MAVALFLVVASYLAGSVSFAVVASKTFGLPDPHTYGSHNPGATNVLRTGHKAAALLTLIGDAAKGWAAVAVAMRVAANGHAPAWTVAAVALAVFLGHLYPVFHQFKGGKGVATAAGIVLALHWPLGILLAAVWLALAFGFRISSLAALATAVLAPVGAFYLLGARPEAWAMVPIAVLLIWRHRTNIAKLMSGSERTIGR